MIERIARSTLVEASRSVRGCMTEYVQVSSALPKGYHQYKNINRSIHTSNNNGGQKAKASLKASASASINLSGSSITSHSITQTTSESFLTNLEQEGEKERMKMSTVQRGTTYEEHVKTFLQNTFPRMDLMRIGGAHDGGIDLTGWWWSPLQNFTESNFSETLKSGRVRITVQCKSEARKLGPRHVREMHGTMVAIQRLGSIDREPLDQLPQSILESSSVPLKDHNDSTPAMAILASSSGFSKQCLLQAFSAPFPLLLVHLLFPDQQANVLQQNSTHFAHPTIVANDALSNGLLKSQLEVRWSSTLATPAVKQGKARKSTPDPIKIDMPALYLGGKRL